MDIPEKYESKYRYIESPPMLRTWISAITKPTVNNFRRLAGHKKATVGTAVRWYLIALVLAAIFNYLLIIFYQPLYFGDYSIVRSIIASVEDNILINRGLVIFYFGFQGLAIQVCFIIVSILLLFMNWLADKKGANGTLDTFAYICIAWIAPITVLSPMLYQTPYVCSIALVLQPVIYSYFMVTTLRAVKRLSVPRSLFVTGVPLFFYVVLIALYFLFLWNVAD